MKIDNIMHIMIPVLFVCAVVLVIIAIVMRRTAKNKKSNFSCSNNCSFCPLNNSCIAPKKSFKIERRDKGSELFK